MGAGDGIPLWRKMLSTSAHLASHTGLMTDFLLVRFGSGGYCWVLPSASLHKFRANSP